MITRNISLLGCVLTVLCLVSGLWIIDRRTSLGASVSQVSVDIDKLSNDLGEWKGEPGGTLGAMELDILRLDRYIKRNYVRASDKSAVFVYLGYWKKQTGDYQAAKHSPLVCFPSNGWRIYDIETSKISKADAPSETLLTSARLTGDIENQTYVTYFWFFTGERIYTQDWQAMLHSSVETLLTGRSDGGIVELMNPVRKDLPREEAIKLAQTQIEDFLREFYPEYAKLMHGN